MPSARFDNLVDDRSSFRLDGYVDKIEAWCPNDVAGAIAAAEAAVRQGRWAAGFVGYEAAPGLDPSLAVRPRSAIDQRLPLVWFGLFERRIGLDRPDRAPDPSVRPGSEVIVWPHIVIGSDADAGTDWRLDTGVDAYHDRVKRVRSHIGDGDTYQVNLTQRWRSSSAGDPTRLYHRLLMAQRPRYGALIETDQWVVASASPELFFQWRDGIVRCRPMKGTAPRGPNDADDAAVGATLVSSGKERAENVMIVDLVRNDLGRVAEYGTVVVTDLFQLERYPTVWQLTSSVTARTRRGTTLVDLFQALFPCGSVTGAPKRRTMELITGVESDCRGVYCGAVGYVGPDESLFNVAIRTVVIDLASGGAVYGTGGGIVWDSDADEEYAEARAKAKILFL